MDTRPMQNDRNTVTPIGTKSRTQPRNRPAAKAHDLLPLADALKEALGYLYTRDLCSCVRKMHDVFGEIALAEKTDPKAPLFLSLRDLAFMAEDSLDSAIHALEAGAR
jgi:hypothetical protein